MPQRRNAVADDILGRCVPNSIVTPFVKRYGRQFQPQPLPKVYRRGGFRVCFANSYRMALRHGLTYVEGYAIASGKELGCLHAWCIDSQGMVLDRTWGLGRAYFGIPFQTQFLKRTIEARRRGGNLYFGLLEDFEGKWHLIEHLGDMPELWLEELCPPKLRLVR